jgi:CHASE3 domain sensor protein
VATLSRPGRQRTLLGGDFFDAVELPDGRVRAMIGDVCGHGPDEAALGVNLRIAWRTLTLAGASSPDLLTTLEEVLVVERHEDVFTTLCTIELSPDRRRLQAWPAGHPAPVLVVPGAAAPLDLTGALRLPLGIESGHPWPSVAVELPEAWTLVLHTDGLIEGRVRGGPERIGEERPRRADRRAARDVADRAGRSGRRARAGRGGPGGRGAVRRRRRPRARLRGAREVTMGSGLARLRVGQWFAVTLAILGAALLAGTVIGTVALSRNQEARRLVVDRLDPALALDERLERALVDQQSGIRGFLLLGREDFLEPYDDGLVEQRRIAARLRTLTGVEELAAVRRDLAQVQRAAERWRADYAEPVRAALLAGGQAPRPSEDVGKARFDAVRGALRTLDAEIVGVRADARDDLEDAAARVRAVLLAVVVVLLALGLVAALALRQAVTQPLAVLAADVRAVARGQFGRPLAAGGARDVAELGTDVESMRRRIVQELAALERARERLETQARDLQRSNAELEQFAYVASHDLQEPLRKVASFCQLLERRYAGQLDERADQYIAFAVDGAKRMQGLINDLLAFSRVGRTGTTTRRWPSRTSWPRRRRRSPPPSRSPGPRWRSARCRGCAATAGCSPSPSRTSSATR